MPLFRSKWKSLLKGQAGIGGCRPINRQLETSLPGERNFVAGLQIFLPQSALKRQEIQKLLDKFN